MSEDPLQEKIQALENELSKLRGEIADLLAAGVETAQKPDTHSAEDAPGADNRFEQKIETAVKAGKHALDEFDEISTRHPLGTLVVAFTVGLLVSRLFDTGRKS